MTITKKEDNETEAVFEETTKQADRVSTFTISQIDSQIERIDSQIVTLQEQKTALEARKTSALALE